ncbi:MAG: class IV adenylate cyclase [Treponema sp.]|nr:class IV adenylate cyclase [Treponema sp.]
MNMEIELKAHITDHEALGLLLSKRAEYLGDFIKDDTYWFPIDNSSGIEKIRMRRQKHSSPGGNEKSECFIGFKKKEVRDNIEVNEETEFEAGPPEAVEEFLREMGYERGISKHKRGSVYKEGEIIAEVLEVEGLGWFIELEILLPKEEASGDLISEKKCCLLNFLLSLGIEEKAIESRFYTEILAGLAK